MSDLWAELHKRALNFKGAQDRVYLMNFKNRIPRTTTGCRCKEFYVIWMRQNPPKFGENGEYFAWTVALHNAVNAKLGKPTYTVEQAKRFYSDSKEKKVYEPKQPEHPQVPECKMQ